MAKKKPFVIIRRGGYYINSIVNDETVINAWKEENLPLTDQDGEANGEGHLPMMPVKKAVRMAMFSFAPATEEEVLSVRAYAPEYKFKYGLLKDR